MDRRQRKTREAIFSAFMRLISRKSYEKITVNDITSEADIGRATFYAHFETKDYLLRSVCDELFGHIIDTALKNVGDRGYCSFGSAEDSVYLHLLRHIKENDRNILSLLSSENNEIFMKYFKGDLIRLINEDVTKKGKLLSCELPEDYTKNFIASTFVETVGWWIRGGLKHPAEQVNRCFETVIGSVIEL